MDVLIVDDDRDTINLLKRYLGNRGFGVLTAHNGSEAFEIFHKSDVRLVVTDRKMPVMNGLDLCQKIRTSDFSEYVYIIILTVCGKKDDIVTGIKAGADDYLIKPFNSEELKVRIDSGLRVLSLDNSLRKKVTEEKILAGELRETLDQVKRLSGLLPVCAACKSIRDDKGYWNESEHFEADFTHSICPACAERHYPDLFNKGKIK